MEITHYCNSFLSVKINDTIIVCDPWTGVTKDNAWLSYPNHNISEKFLKNLKPNYIYISHLHCDHFDSKTLNKFNKNTSIIIKNFKDSRLKKKINNLGFKNIIECNSWDKKKLNKDLTIAIVPQISNNSEDIDNGIFYDLDSSILIQSNSDKKVFFNTVDNPLSLQNYKFIKNYIKKKFKSKIFAACMPVGSASEYPHCFLGINKEAKKKRVISQILGQVKKKINIIKPNLFFPAGGNYILYGKFAKLDKFLATPDFSETYKKIKIKETKVIDLLGKTLSIKNGNLKIHKAKSGSKQYTRSQLKIKFINKKYHYEKTKIKILPDDLDKLYKQCSKNYYWRLSREKVNTSWDIDFFIYKNLQLKSSEKIINSKNNLLRKYSLSYKKNIKKHSSLECHLDAKLFISLLKRTYPWNPVLSGSMIIFKRDPDKFDPNLTFSLNYLGL